MGQSTDHALLSPSGASKWIACTPSVRLEQQFPDSSGAAAREGTLAHSISELLLKKHIGTISLQLFKKFLQQLISEDAASEGFYNEAMLEYCQQYATFVIEKLAESKTHTPGAKLFVEKKLDISKWAQDSFGTGDAGIVADTTLKCIDLKYGKGVEVSAVNNTQMKIYALGWLEEFDGLYDITEVEMTIFQPRIDNYSTWTISVKELLEWAENVVRPRAILAFAGEGDFAPGSHCQFCRVKPRCKALADYNMELLKHEFAEPALLSDDDIADILSKTGMLVNWANTIDDYALQQAVGHNKKWPGFKLVEGRSNRVITDEEAVIKLLKAQKLSEDVIFNRKLVALGDIEKLLGGPKKSKELLSAYIKKPKGKPALVPQDDKREEYVLDGAKAEDFNDDYELI